MKKKIFILSFLIFILNSLFLILNCPCQWIQKSNGITSGYPYALMSSPTGIYAGTGDGVCYSTNKGENWTIIGLDSLDIRSLAISENKLFAGTVTYGIYVSTNNGLNWAQSSMTNETVWDIFQAGSNLLAGTYNGVYISMDNGVSWQSTGLNKIVYDFIKSGTYVFAGTFGSGVYRSSNNGQNWTSTTLTGRVVRGFTGSSDFNAAATDNGIYITTDNGTSWTQSGLTSFSTWSAGNYMYNIFAGTMANGVHRTTNNGTNWEAINDGLPGSSSIWSMLIDTPYIYVGTYGSKVWRRNLSEIVITGIKLISENVPSGFLLEQNYPNPFNSVTSIKFKVPMDSRIRGNDNVVLRVFDLMGREVATPVNEKLQPGTYQVSFDASSLPSGLYFYRMVMNGYSETRKFVLLK